MADNPLAEDPAREQRIRERAYHLWEQDGRPHGRDQEYWERARELVAIEESAGAALIDNPMNHPDSPRETGIEEAEIQENLGEFPDRFADQGEVQQVPSAKKARAPKKSQNSASPSPARRRTADRSAASQLRTD